MWWLLWFALQEPAVQNETLWLHQIGAQLDPKPAVSLFRVRRPDKTIWLLEASAVCQGFVAEEPVSLTWRGTKEDFAKGAANLRPLHRPAVRACPIRKATIQPR